MQGALVGRRGAVRGRDVSAAPVRTGPRPAQRPHPPLWLAGNSERGLARAARIGDGWHGIDLSPDELRPLAARGRELAAEQGKKAFTISIRKGVLPGGPVGHPLYGDRDAIRRDLDAYRAAGLDYLVAGLRRATSPDDAVRALEQVAATLGT